MAWHDDFVAELVALLPAEEVLAIAEAADPSFAATRRERERERVAAVEKGRQLLLAHLDDGQRATFEAAGYFDVVGSEGGRYRITGAGSIHQYAADGRTHGYGLCFHTRHPVPTTDNALAQALFIEHHEAEMLRMVGLR